jgi:hypothetical protein
MCDSSAQSPGALKKCSKCGVEKPLECFAKDKKGSSGVGYWCRECSSDNNKNRASRHLPTRNVGGVKKCIKCNVDKPVLDFNKSSHHKDGLTSLCKLCNSNKGATARSILKSRDWSLIKVPESKKCRVCGLVKEGTNFGKNKSRVDGLGDTCRKCHRDLRIERRYKVSKYWYDDQLVKQGGKCAICGTSNPETGDKKHFSIDHDHFTGKIRGLLCNVCNVFIGDARDSVSILKKAIAYLEYYGVVDRCVA